MTDQYSEDIKIICDDIKTLNINNKNIIEYLGNLHKTEKDYYIITECLNKLYKQDKSKFEFLYRIYKFDYILSYMLDRYETFNNIKTFIEDYKMNINIVDFNNKSLLMKSIELWDIDIDDSLDGISIDKITNNWCNYLITNKIDLSIKDYRGETALDYAKHKKFYNIVELIKNNYCSTCGNYN